MTNILTRVFNFVFFPEQNDEEEEEEKEERDEEKKESEVIWSNNLEQFCLVHADGSVEDLDDESSEGVVAILEELQTPTTEGAYQKATYKDGDIFYDWYRVKPKSMYNEAASEQSGIDVYGPAVLRVPKQKKNNKKK